MSLLTIVQNVCRINGLPVPGFVVSSSDNTTQQMLGLANELLDSMIDESKFQAFTKQALWTYIADEDQGDLNDICPGYLWVNNGTFWDRTLLRPVYGPITDVEWQQIKAVPNPGPYYKYRIMGNHLLINPVPTDPLSLIAFEYATSYGVEAADGTPKQYFTEDTDTFLLPERILQRGLSYRWKQVKGLPYQADETAYFSMLNNAIARDATKRIYNLAGKSDLWGRPGFYAAAWSSAPPGSEVNPDGGYELRD